MHIILLYYLALSLYIKHPAFSNFVFDGITPRKH